MELGGRIVHGTVKNPFKVWQNQDLLDDDEKNGHLLISTTVRFGAACLNLRGMLSYGIVCCTECHSSLINVCVVFCFVTRIHSQCPANS